ncbi:MAG: hypothetical protein NTV54_15780 [Ignavibacteriales bacterium]|nr:hypothetical protein [Ignavibacteriales bacterium]
MKTKLDSAERAIEKAVGSYRSVSGKSRKHIESILERSRKSRNINIRISETTLAVLKRRSVQEGLPHQTLISSILHKYLMNRFIDQESISKSMELLRSGR